ncbi:hypothetical protein CI102_9862 [Trichoderma harzianum]|uniref:Zn(2)-C6 fungal-type domain-containing protein n=1 Tax=Trichoderma harzianum CBS 226.95 TaxID=983964 RepID=A0A2T3ZTS3_TRIHA|nr:hypothetical protein M431DRAFT_513771 [Trichoderma harzianum CBS 226.95]PKK49620.1 hypothetical protein CI102_9862 [Trichoderma harzianum]PTB48200.1 hypothetical protein M431DRAFT_513771 [Trichoderma harzianum CBS 226.95]
MVRTAGRSAPYGQACLSCFKTKCKCIPRLEGSGCERCHRLKRPCHPADVLRRRSDKKQNSPDDRIAKLEGTLGQLVSLLQAGNVNVDIMNSIGNVGNMGNMSDIQGDRVSLWSHQQHQQQQQQQNSPPQQDQHQHQEQQQMPQSQSMLEAEATEHHATTLMQTPPSVTYQDVVAEGSGRSDTVEEPRNSFNDEDEHTGTCVTGVAAPWWATDNTNGFNANSISLTTPPSTVLDAFMSPSVSPPSASVSLDTFRSRMLHHFPFVHLPTHLTAEQLRIERPFLFRAIVCVTSASSEDKRESSLELKRVLCEMAFLQLSPHQKQHQPQQTIDLLLGLLVFIAWGWEHLHSRRSLSRLMAVATSLAGELRSLDQTAPDITHTISQLEPRGGFDDVYSNTTATTITAATVLGAGWTNARLYLERQRAILGCFVLGSAVSAYFSQVDAPRWVTQMDEGLAAITASGSSSVGAEGVSDAALAIQVRLQLLAMKATQVRERAQLPDHPPPETLSPQALLCIKGLMGQLQEVRASVPQAFQQHFVLLAQTYYTEMCIIDTIHVPPSTHGPPARPPPPTCGPTRLSCYWQSALAIKSCTSTFLTLSPSGLLGVSFIQWAQLARCVATLHQLSAYQEPGWDPAALRDLVNLPVLISCMADKLELAAAEAGEHPMSADGVFAQLARGLRSYKPDYHDRGFLVQQEESRREAEERDGAVTTTATVTDTNSEALTYGQEAGYLMSPTLWLDQFFVDFKD